MIYELNDTSRVQVLFGGWEETLIYACLQKIMGKIYVTNLGEPKSAFAFVGCFGFLAGVPDRELVLYRPAAFEILTPQNEVWAALIEECYPDAKKVMRFAIRKDTRFDRERLTRFANILPKGYELRAIDANLHDQCLKNAFTEDFVSSFGNKEQYLEYGRGVVIVKNGEIVAGASSYARYKGGIEIEVDTAESERRKGLATAACSALILNCLNEGLYPSWDAQNMDSVRLAEKLGYEFDHAYTAYETFHSEK